MIPPDLRKERRRVGSGRLETGDWARVVRPGQCRQGTPEAEWKAQAIGNEKKKKGRSETLDTARKRVPGSKMGLVCLVVLFTLHMEWGQPSTFFGPFLVIVRSVSPPNGWGAAPWSVSLTLVCVFLWRKHPGESSECCFCCCLQGAQKR